ncbi:NAD(P)-binding domain-containing protein [Gemmatimonas sp.]|uniref:NAD(P)-binding domain-containing protein n=1 Tax=Gemmatimonas sp. TaxID=1962908 RepID=UPI003982DCBE
MFLLPFHVIGCSHEQNDVEAVGRLRVLPAQLPAQLLSLRALGIPAVLVSTCHRTELYWWGEHDPSEWFGALLKDRGVPDVQLERKHADLAVRRLFAVSAGMCSARFGEPEILGQVRRAWSASHEVGATNALLDSVFRHAVDAARHIRAAIGTPASASLGMRVRDALQDLVETRVVAPTPHDVSAPLHVLVVGAGDAARIVVSALADGRRVGAPVVCVTSRTDSRAESLANTHGAMHVSWSSREAAMSTSDVVIFAAHPTTPIVTAAQARELLREREAPSIWIDLGVPSNVGNAAALPESVQYVDLEWLAMYAGDALGAADIGARANVALQRELARFAGVMHRRQVGARLALLETRAVHAARAALESHALKAGTDSSAEHAADVMVRQVTRLLLRELTALSA